MYSVTYNAIQSANLNQRKQVKDKIYYTVFAWRTAQAARAKAPADRATMTPALSGSEAAKHIQETDRDNKDSFAVYTYERTPVEVAKQLNSVRVCVQASHPNYTTTAIVQGGED